MSDDKWSPRALRASVSRLKRQQALALQLLLPARAISAIGLRVSGAGRRSKLPENGWGRRLLFVDQGCLEMRPIVSNCSLVPAVCGPLNPPAPEIPWRVPKPSAHR